MPAHINGHATLVPGPKDPAPKFNFKVESKHATYVPEYSSPSASSNDTPGASMPMSYLPATESTNSHLQSRKVSSFIEEKKSLVSVVSSSVMHPQTPPNDHQNLPAQHSEQEDGPAVEQKLARQPGLPPYILNTVMAQTDSQDRSQSQTSHATDHYQNSKMSPSYSHAQHSDIETGTSPPPPASGRLSYLSSSSSDDEDDDEENDSVPCLPSNSTDIGRFEKAINSRESQTLSATSSAETLTGFHLASGSYPKQAVRPSSRAFAEYEWILNAKGTRSAKRITVDTSSAPTPTNRSPSSIPSQSPSSFNPKQSRTSAQSPYYTESPSPHNLTPICSESDEQGDTPTQHKQSQKKHYHHHHSQPTSPIMTALAHPKKQSSKQSGRHFTRSLFPPSNESKSPHNPTQSVPEPTQSPPMPPVPTHSRAANNAYSNVHLEVTQPTSVPQRQVAPSTLNGNASSGATMSQPNSQQPSGVTAYGVGPTQDNWALNSGIVEQGNSGSARRLQFERNVDTMSSNHLLLSSNMRENHALAVAAAPPLYSTSRTESSSRRQERKAQQSRMFQGGRKGQQQGRHHLQHFLTLLISKYPLQEHSRYVNQVTKVSSRAAAKDCQNQHSQHSQEQRERRKPLQIEGFITDGLLASQRHEEIRQQRGGRGGQQVQTYARTSRRGGNGIGRYELFSKVALESYQDIHTPMNGSTLGVQGKEDATKVVVEERIRTPFRVSRRSKQQLKEKCDYLAYIEWRLSQKGHRRKLSSALSRQLRDSYKGLFDRMSTCAFVWGQRIFHAWTPYKYNQGLGMFAALFQIVIWLLYFYMAAEFPRYRSTQMLQQLEPIEPEYFPIGPKGLFKWVINRDSQRQFSAEFLILWGARYLPNMTEGHGFWRWFTMPLLHQSFSHVFSNMLLSLFVAGYLERKYGSLRTLVVAFAALLTSSFLSAAFEDSCAVIVGASGVVFGLGAMYLCDMLFNFSTCTYPFVRLLGVLLFLVTFIITLTYASATSHIAHVGGVTGGLIFSLLIQPSLRWELLEAFTPFVAMVWAILTLVCLPLYIYGSVLKTGVDKCVEVSGTVTIFGQEDFFTMESTGV